MTKTYAAETEVPVSQSREEIRAALKSAGATKIGFMDEETRAIVFFELGNISYLIRLPMPTPEDVKFLETGKLRTAAQCESAYYQLERSRWRSLGRSPIPKTPPFKKEFCQSKVEKSSPQLYLHRTTPNIPHNPRGISQIKTGNARQTIPDIGPYKSGAIDPQRCHPVSHILYKYLTDCRTIGSVDPRPSRKQSHSKSQ